MRGDPGGEYPLTRSELGLAVLETVRSPLLVLEDDLTIRSANPAFCENFGGSAPELVGRNFLDVGDGQWDQPEFQSLLRAVLPTNTEVRDLEVRVHLGAMGPRILRVNARRLELEGEGQKYILLALDDRTRQEALEEEVQRHVVQLERSNRDLQAFAHAASHDLQEPLRKVRTYASRLSASLPPEGLDEQQKKYLERMHQATERMQLRIDDMLKLARLARASAPLHPIPLQGLVEGVVADLDAAVEVAGGRVTVAELPTVAGDPPQLELLFQNLLANSLKFRRDGVPPEIRVEGETREAGVVIRVTDNGIGFEPEYRERIFRPFERLHGVDGFEGTGVGLSICRKVMENHGGEISAEGRPGAGATFTLQFPPPDPEKV